MNVVSLALLLTSAVRGLAASQADAHAAPVTASPPEFFARVEHDVGGKPEYLTAGDVDGDGRVDLVIALQSPGELLVARGKDPDPILAAERIVIGGYPLRPQLVRWRDPADTKVRTVIAVASRADRKLVVVDVSRRGEPRILLERALPGAPLAIATGDFDATTSTDAIFVALDDHELVVQKGTRDLERRKDVLRGDLPRCISFAAPRTFVGFQNLDALDILRASSPRTIDLGGLPRDTTPCTVAGAHGFAVASGDRDVRFWSDEGATTAAFETAPIPVRILARDLDNALGDELATLSYAGDACEVWRARRTNESTIAVTRASTCYAGQTPTDMALADFDGDSKLDLAIANRDAQRISLLRGIGDGSFRTAPRVHVGSFPSRVRALHSDNITAALIVLDAKEAALSVLTPGAGTWSETQRFPIDPPPLLLACADLDGDGVDEALVLSRATNITTLRVFSFSSNRLVPREIGGTSHWPGSATEMILARTPNATTLWYVDAEHNRLGRVSILTDAQHHLATEGPNEIELAGAPNSLTLLHESNQPDRLVVTRRAISKLAVIPISADMNSLHIQSEVDCTGSLIDVRAADFDGDGVLDLAVLARTDAHSMQGSVHVLRGAEGTWKESTVMTTGLSAFHLACADVDGDGRADVLVPCQDSHSVELFWSRPTDHGIVFERRPALGAGLGCIDVDTVDIDGDGRIDLTVANSSSDDVSVLVNCTRR